MNRSKVEPIEHSGSDSIRKPFLSGGVILRDFSPEEPALSEVEGISRASTATQR